MLDKERLFKMIMICGGCGLLLFAFQRCSPISPSTSKTLLNPPIPIQGATVNTSPQDIAELFDEEIQLKAKFVSSPVFEELAEQTSIQAKDSKMAIEPANLSPTPQNQTVVVLDESQLKSLREHHKALIQLSENPQEVSIYVEPVATAQANSKKENEENIFAEVELKSISGNTWRLTIQKSQGLSTNENQWILNNIQNVMIRFSRIPAKGHTN